MRIICVLPGSSAGPSANPVDPSWPSRSFKDASCPSSFHHQPHSHWPSSFFLPGSLFFLRHPGWHTHLLPGLPWPHHHSLQLECPRPRSLSTLHQHLPLTPLHYVWKLDLQATETKSLLTSAETECTDQCQVA
jgi:hypothetical protein